VILLIKKAFLTEGFFLKIAKKSTIQNKRTQSLNGLDSGLQFLALEQPQDKLAGWLQWK
jgi:hypothetical protein